MPEGDTVWLTGQRLHRQLSGGVLLSSDFRVPQLATADLSGREVLEVVTRGKHLLIRTDTARRTSPVTVHTHLRMDGAWHLTSPGRRWSGGPAHQLRVILTTADAVALGYRVHDVAVAPTAEENRWVGHLGPDLLGPDWDPAEAVRRLGAHPGLEIGVALLDQRLLAGIGNLYKCEVLFLRGVSPWTTVGQIPGLTAMVTLAQRLLSANRDHPAQITTGSSRRGEQHWVYERTGQPCRRCGTAIRSAQQDSARHDSARQNLPRHDSARQRRTYWCPNCQPADG
jgi:endonuclease-8